MRRVLNFMNDHASVVRVERHEPGAGRRDEVAGVLKSAAEAARDAHGCYGAQVTSSDREPTQIVLIERWESSDAMKKFHERSEFTSLERTLDDSPKVEVFTTA
jgi:quinol monooxygenase YgiN